MSNSLQNCTITSYSAQEFAGDSVGGGTLEAQTLPSGTGYTSSQAQVFNSYFLKISPLPDYHIKSTMVLIGDIYPSTTTGTSPLDTEVRSWQMGSTTTGAAIVQYQGTLNQVRIYDTLTDGDTNCNNEIIVMVILDTSFVMPNNNVNINLDFECIAEQCYVELEVEDDPIIGYLECDLMIHSNYDNCSIFVAKYFDEALYAGSQYQKQNRGYYLQTISTQSSSNWSYFDIPVYDPLGEWQNQNSDFFVGPNSPLSSFAPTTYNQYTGDALIHYFWYEEAQTPYGVEYPWLSWFNTTGFTGNGNVQLNYSNGVPVATDCGSVLIDVPPEIPSDNYNSADMLVNGDYVYNITEHPNASSNPQPANLQRNERWTIYATDTEGDGDWPVFLSPIDYPDLSPGDGILPTHLSWYISVGDNPNYELIAETAEVWRIISTRAYGLYQNSSILSQCGGGNFGGGYTNDGSNVWPIFVSETNSSGVVTQNNSIFDLSNVEITQVVNSDGSLDRKTIKLKVPFRTDIAIEFWERTHQNNNLFLNIYPTEI